ncbi:MAG: bifunctional glycosyltransferase family 2 protein/CDP-glycerol:glycerophosphate glycerophosphotransferase [Lachnospiraceae bacterium]|nr:bifunctional glycosyltransferase family 2 protein/CDP-glycerol:glycerophosphate glycerophosphotransferase [Lachnospiraceae bacterium]
MQTPKIKVSIILPVYNVEEYLTKALESFKEQTLDEFEVIMIDDGSTDSSAEIMKEFASEDGRFKCFFQENRGVSATRNRGIEIAGGEYIAFYDSDDWIRPTVLEKMYATAKTRNADIVVGRMREFSVTKEYIYSETKGLSKKQEIEKYDYGLVWNLSLANKLFKKDLIVENALCFAPIAYSEDGLFLMQCVVKAQKISGCSVVAYEYRKRPLWKERSVTQRTDGRLFDDFVYAHESIFKIMDTCFGNSMEQLRSENASEGAQNELSVIKLNYMAELYYKLVVSIINAFYRQLWQADDCLEKKIISKFEEYKKKIFSRQMGRLIDHNKDLSIEEGLCTKKQLVETPLVTVAITGNVSAEQINSVLFSVYNQTLVSFEVYVHNKLEEHIDVVYKNMFNLNVIEADSVAEYKNTVLQSAGSNFINIIDEDIILPENTLKNMYFSAINNNCGFVTVPIRGIDDECARYMKCNTVLYSGKYVNKKLPFNISLLDNILGNKLLNVSKLHENEFSFSDEVVTDIQWLYKNFSCKKRSDLCVFSYFDETFLLSRVKKTAPRILYRIVRDLELLRVKSSRNNFIKRLQMKRSQAGRALRDIIQKHLVVRRRVFFYTPRSTKVLLENSKAVYDILNCKKVVFAKLGRHSKLEQWKIKYYLFTSKVIVTDDYCDYLGRVELKPEQKVVQIWHACGAFKKFGLDYLLNDRQKEKGIHRQYDVVCVSSENICADYAGAFGIDIDKVQALGVPRTDMFFNLQLIQKVKDQFYKDHPEYIQKRILLYCPTFREKRGIKVANDPQIDWDVFSRLLPEDTILLIKNHPRVKKDLLEGGQYFNIVNTDENTNTLMIVADIMITDYSSVIFECCLLNMPIIFYCPDYEEYERDFYLEFPQDTYGDFTVNQDELQEAVLRNLKNPNFEKLAEFREKNMGACDGHSTERIADMIKKLVYER